MVPKRSRAGSNLDPNLFTPAPKRARFNPTVTAPLKCLPPTATNRRHDHLSPLSDELLLRILFFLSLPHLLTVAPLSRRFYRLAGDSQLWKALYYTRFVLPRALRIPGFRDKTSENGHQLHYAGRRALGADGRKGGLVRMAENWRGQRTAVRREKEKDKDDMQAVDWKRQFKIRHNWARGKCAVDELRLGVEGDQEHSITGRHALLVKVVEGVAITADQQLGLRAWDLKSRQLLAQISLGRGTTESNGEDSIPSCLAVDDNEFDEHVLEIAVGFSDGSFEVWRLHVIEKSLVQRYRHEGSSNGKLIAVAYSHPYLLTATESVLISLYTFDVAAGAEHSNLEERLASTTRTVGGARLDWDSESSCTLDEFSSETEREDVPTKRSGQKCGTDASLSLSLQAPLLLTSLKSHTSRPPLALSIRRLAASTIASIAYTFSTMQGWSIGLQDLHVRRSDSDSGNKSAPEITTTRLAYTPSMDMGVSLATSDHSEPLFSSTEASSPVRSPSDGFEPGPTTLCYTHPYLLATLPDNTLVLHLCTSNASSLTISPGIRLWGHTSGISDAEITSRGKAVSVSSRGEEMRVWELEGRLSGIASRSVEIRPGQLPAGAAGLVDDDDSGNSAAKYDWDERRNWVGFDNEMVIVLKEKRDGRESLMVYDFT